MSNNLVESIGYTIERIHSGLLAHLFKSNRPEYRACGREVLRALGCELEEDQIVHAKHEWKNIDLVLTSEEGTPLVAFEFKVDSREGTVRGKPQTEAYHERLEAKAPGVPLLYVTLGLATVYSKPEGDHYDWVDLDRFLEAVKCTIHLDGVGTRAPGIYADWIQALETEVQRKKVVEDGRHEAPEPYFRPGAWNIYLMASLREELIHKEELPVWRNSSLYTYGQKPDTIWNLGRLPEREQHLYAEVNSNGMLNLKIKFRPDEGGSSKEAEFFDAQKAMKNRLELQVEPKSRGGFTGKSKTLLSVDVGFCVESGRFAFAESREHVLDRLRWVASELSLLG